MLRYKVTTAATVHPILATDATVHDHMRIGANDTSYDALIAEYILAATLEIERYIGYPLMTQVVEIRIDKTLIVNQPLIGNINDIISYSYYDGSSTITETGVLATGLPINKYGNMAYTLNRAWPSGSEYKIKCNAGYTIILCPDDIKQACRLLVLSYFENREGKQEMPATVTRILDLHAL